jgi:hypothetical protein
MLIASWKLPSGSHPAALARSGSKTFVTRLDGSFVFPHQP